ncbi:MAG: UDP-N-acetylglucosamine 1-carboxyvinyltransferase [Candidatus Azambacteria bacterium GW2011_GWA1_44_9]|uniref:UDP-N-acetylglucosamine 1-carboxyvinyltransferase n=1 Tax=Candidatus Azambacteria bacterium GW2011_GWA1_44_9 TaxID=1618610 RepID=A0A0G1ND98_9BACT|nr:MAG: UDP-N-acetylglucosamine 1-carboxyvinyltransferase [Candidatus Azambacteria bacterium GW2011_GWA1_44_9]
MIKTILTLLVSLAVVLPVGAQEVNAIKNARQDVKDIREDAREGIKDARETAIQELKAKRDELKAASEKKRGDFKAAVEQKREAVKQQVEAKRAELKEKLKTIKDERKKQVVEKIDQHRVLVTGPTPLHGAEIEVPDIRAGFSYIVGALMAQGTTTVTNSQILNRGYEKFTEKLQNLGAQLL